jgi:hypothetical protein
MNASRTKARTANLRIVESKDNSEGLSFYASMVLPDPQNRGEGAFTQSPYATNVFNLPSYRRQRSLRHCRIADPERPRSFDVSGSEVRNPAFDANYTERMKVNGGIFVFLTFFILSGVWLMDGLSKAFGR